MTGVPPSPTSAGSHSRYPSRRSILLHSIDITDQAQPLYANTLHNVHCPTRIGSKILRSIFYSNTFKAAASVPKRQCQCLSGINVHLEDEHLVGYEFCRTRKDSTTNLSIETILKYVRKDKFFLFFTWLLNTVQDTQLILGTKYNV